MSTFTIRYLRYDGSSTNKPEKLPKNFYLNIYHVNNSYFKKKVTASKLLDYVKNTHYIKQKYTTGIIIGSDIVEWDNLSSRLTNVDENSALIIFVIQKSGKLVPLLNDIADFFYIPDLLNKFTNNPNLVYNTDNYYLLEMNSAIDVFDQLNPKPTKSPSGIYIQSNTDIHQLYQSIYDTTLDNEIDSEVDEIVKNDCPNCTPEQLKKLKKIIKLTFLNDVNKMASIEAKVIEEFNNKYRSQFYQKFLNDQSYDSIDVIAKMEKNIQNIKCYIPPSNKIDIIEQDFNLKLSIHYTQ